MDASLEAVEHELSRCSDCGLCNAVCTTFQATQWESEGPRGRIALARDLQKGRSSPATQSLSTYDRCLSCGLCDAVCPSQVRFSVIREGVQRLRRPFVSRQQDPYELAEARKLLKRLSSHARRKWLGPILRRHLLPTVKATSRPVARTGKWMLFPTCLQDLLFPNILSAALSVSDRLGLDVGLGSFHGCCGALYDRLVDQVPEVEKERRQCRSDWQKRLSPHVLVLSSPCQHATQNLTPGLSYLRFSQLVLQGIGDVQLKLARPMDLHALQACAAGPEYDEWMELMAKIEGLTVRPLSLSVCCGGRDLESIVHPKHAEHCAAPVLEDNPQGILTLSDHCALQLKRQGREVWHPVEILALAL